MNQNNDSSPTGFFAGLRKSGLYRTDERWIGGVSGALGQHLKVDPILIRTGFIILGIFGIGLIFYGAAWLLLPDARDNRIVAEDLTNGHIGGSFIAAALMILIGLGGPFWIGFSWWNSSFFTLPGGIGIAVTVIVLWAVFKDKGVFNSNQSRGPGGPGNPGGYPGGQGAEQSTQAPGTPGPNSPAEAHSAGEATTSIIDHEDAPDSKAGADADPHTTPLGPPSGPSPHGDVPPPPPPPRRQPNKGMGVTYFAAVLGIALIAIAITVGVGLDSDPWWLLPAGVGVIILGLGVIGAGLRGRIGAPLGTIAVLITIFSMVSNYGWISHGTVLGELNWTPETQAELSEGRAVGVGQLNVDLSTVPITSDAETSVRVGVGDATVIIPNDRPVTVTTTLGVGDVSGEFHSDTRSPFPGKQTFTYGENVKNKPTLDVEVSGAVGDLSIERAPGGKASHS